MSKLDGSVTPAVGAADDSRLLPGWLRLMCWCAGLMDTCTGVLLVTAPSWTLDLVMIPAEGVEPQFIRFIGIFVFGVGFTYLVPFLEPSRFGALRQRVRDALRMTAWVRLCVGSFLAVSLMLSAMPLGWTTVAVTDLALAMLQFWITGGRSGELWASRGRGE